MIWSLKMRANGENDVEEIEPEKAHEEKNQKQSQITDFFRTQK